MKYSEKFQNIPRITFQFFFSKSQEIKNFQISEKIKNHSESRIKNLKVNNQHIRVSVIISCEIIKIRIPNSQIAQQQSKYHKARELNDQLKLSQESEYQESKVSKYF